MSKIKIVRKFRLTFSFIHHMVPYRVLVAGTVERKGTNYCTVKSPNFVTAHNFVTNGQQFLEESI
jgi:hypothetical protein